MKVEDMMKVLGIAASAFLLLVSCIKEEPTVLSAGLPETVGDPVSVTISLNTSDILAGTSLQISEQESTKAIIDTLDESCIHNLWVAQYGGTNDNAVLIGAAKYIPESEFNRYPGTDSLDVPVTLVDPSDSSTVFLLANSFDPELVFPTTLGAVKSMSRTVSSKNDILINDGTGGHICFVGKFKTGHIPMASFFSVGMRRNIAKIKLRLVNNSFSSSDRIHIDSVSFASVPSISYYFPELGNPSVLPQPSTFSTFDFPFEAWSGTGNQDVASDSSDFICYLPVNKRGTVVNGSQAAKGRFNPGQATYAIVKGSYLSDTVMVPLNYVFYLGANLVDDFNIEPNRYYQYRIDFKKKGDSRLDDRVKDYGPVDYTLSSYDRANSYILNPPEIENYWRTFSIPVDRVNTFWGRTSIHYESVTENQLGPDDTWRAEIIWNDTPTLNDNFRFSSGTTTASGTGTDPISVQVRNGAQGNVLIGLKKLKTDGTWTDYLWSWHLWITDYSPDDVNTYQTHPLQNVFAYDVNGGRVFRHNGINWNQGAEGLYVNSFIMDRNLGEFTTEYHSRNDRGALYYQFGRKDPLRVQIVKNKGVWITDPLVSATAAEPAKPLYYTISHPDWILLNNAYCKNPLITTSVLGDWMKGNKYNPVPYDEAILWMDPQATSQNHRKSIFDPCPPGWKVPESGCYRFNANDYVTATGYDAIYKVYEKFPKMGAIYADNPANANSNSSSSGNALLWVSTTKSIGFACYLFNASDANAEHFTKSTAMPVRCVRE